MKYSIVVPVYNRPAELQDLLESLAEQSYKDFEVIIVDDGSTLTAESIAHLFYSSLNIRYYFKNNSGPGLSRNIGLKHAHGEYFIMLDSDCIVPRDYLNNIHNHLSNNYLDAFGGPDTAHDTFTPIQKAFNYSMTSYLTTGGIRGRRKHVGRFHPRSFNMGMSKEVYEKTNGFSSMRYGEDIELSIRIINCGYRVGLIENAMVYHKRRTRVSEFFKQVFRSGCARVDIYKIHPKELHAAHVFPSAFLLYCIIMILAFFASGNMFSLLMIVFTGYMTAIVVDSGRQYKSIKIGVLSVMATVVQLFGYGLGFGRSYYSKVILNG